MWLLGSASTMGRRRERTDSLARSGLRSTISGEQISTWLMEKPRLMAKGPALQSLAETQTMSKMPSLVDPEQSKKILVG